MPTITKHTAYAFFTPKGERWGRFVPLDSKETAKCQELRKRICRNPEFQRQLKVFGESSDDLEISIQESEEGPISFWQRGSPQKVKQIKYSDLNERVPLTVEEPPAATVSESPSIKSDAPADEPGDMGRIVEALIKSNAKKDQMLESLINSLQDENRALKKRKPISRPSSILKFEDEQQKQKKPPRNPPDKKPFSPTVVLTKESEHLESSPQSPLINLAKSLPLPLTQEPLPLTSEEVREQRLNFLREQRLNFYGGKFLAETPLEAPVTLGLQPISPEAAPPVTKPQLTSSTPPEENLPPSPLVKDLLDADKEETSSISSEEEEEGQRPSETPSLMDQPRDLKAVTEGPALTRTQTFLNKKTLTLVSSLFLILTFFFFNSRLNISDSRL